MGAQIIDIAAVRTRLKLGLPICDKSPTLVPESVPGVEVGSWVVTPTGLIAFFARSFTVSGHVFACLKAGDGITQSWKVAQLKPAASPVT